MLCSYCEEEYHETSTKECQKCPSDLAIWPLAVAAVSCPMVLALAIWFWVFRPTTHDLLQETPWDRKGEFVEQALMFLSYIQVLKLGNPNPEDVFSFLSTHWSVCLVLREDLFDRFWQQTELEPG